MTESTNPGSSTTSVDASQPADQVVVQTGAIARTSWDWRRDARTALIATLVAAAAVGGLYGHLSQNPTVRFGLVDIAEVVEIEQLRVTSQVLKPELTAAEKDVYFKQASAFGPRLEEAITVLKRDCRCELLARNAYVGSGAEDLTEALKRHMGQAGLNLEQMRAVGKAAFMARLPSPAQQQAAATPAGVRP